MNSEDIAFYNPNRLGDLLFIFHTNHKKYLNDKLAEYDLNLVQVLCMLKIIEEEHICQKDLSDGFYLTKGAITKAVTKLEQNNYITREKSEHDRRQYNLELTQKGKNIIPVLYEINHDWETKMGFDELKPEFYELFKKLTSRSVELNDD